jgi:tetratricopeptide (TPR) repeat protein
MNTSTVAEPKDPDAIVKSARALARDGRLDDAYRALAEGESQFPTIATFLVQKAKIARDAGQRAEAGRLLALSRERFPDDEESVIESGWLAHINRDWAEAARWWESVRTRTPQHLVGYINGAVALREQGRSGEAEELLKSAMARFPHQASPWIEYATCAQATRDWSQSAERWREVRTRFAAVPEAYLGAATAFREQRKFSEAQDVLDEAAQRFPGDLRVKTEHCWLAHVAHDWPEAVRRWEALRANHPELPVGWTSAAVALRNANRFSDAEDLLRSAMSVFPLERAAWVEYAWLASAARNWPAASRRWGYVRERFPDFAEGYLRGASAAAELWKHAEAEALLQEGMRRFTSDASLCNDYAAMALRQNRLDEAAARYATLRERFPEHVEGYLGGASVLRNSFRLPEAESLLESAFLKFPSEARLWLEHARLPVFAPLRSDRRPDEALRRLAAIRERFPDLVEGYTAAVRILIDEGERDAAEALAAAAVERFPENALATVEHANLAAVRGDAPLALNRYQAAVDRFPAEAGARIGLAMALAATGRVAEGEAQLRQLMEGAPKPAAAYTAFAELAMQRGDWAEALVRWQAAHQQFPDDKSFVQRIFDVQLHLTGEGSGADEAQPTATSNETESRGELNELVMGFESLGGRGIGCEFGMFQREFGAEPLGLLRWADMPFEGIVQVLETRFAGVGDPENTEVFVNRANARPEYCTRDLRGFMFMRAFVYEDEMPMERMRKQALRRLKFLKDKLIADLEAGTKIFVWRCTERNLTDEEIGRLHAAVRTYGDTTLLYVRYEVEGKPNGTAELREPGLMIGYIDRFKQALDGTLASAPPTASWVTLCENASRLFSKRTLN